MINLGDRVKDVVSGFTGIVIARTEWLNGCVRFTIQPPVGKDGKLPDNGCFDMEQLIVLEVLAVNSKSISSPRKKISTGGDRPDVGMREIVSR